MAPVLSTSHIGVRDPKFIKYRDFKRFHQVGVAAAYVIVTQKMQHSMHD